MTSLNALRLARAMPALRALSQRGAATSSHASCPAAEASKRQSALNAAMAISRKAKAAVAPAGLNSKVEQHLAQQLQAFEAAVRPDAAMQAASEHLQGIPLKSKREYKQLIAQYVQKRS
jgi:hypothetical protein